MSTFWVSVSTTGIGVLSGVLLSAAFSKFRTPRRSARMFEPLGVSGWPSTIGVLSLSTAELIAGAGLLSPYQRIASAGTAILLTLFTVVVALVLSARIPLMCACFGEFGRPISRTTLIRNIMLTGVACLVAWFCWTDGPLPVFQTSAERWLVAVLIATVIVTNLRPRYLRSPTENDGLALRSEAPDFTLATASGQMQSLSGLLELGKSVAVVFVRAGCGGCEALEADLDRWADSRRHDLQFLVVSEGGHGRTSHFTRHIVVLQANREIAESYRLRTTPAMVIVDIDGRVAVPPLIGTLGILRHFAH
jgi:hypothetical protein